MNAASTRRAAARTLVALACAALPSAGCGKKGPPLAPLIRLPIAPLQVSAARAGNEVTIRFVVPNANVSGVRPADIERVDVYAWTGPPLKAADVFKRATVVASVPVRPPPPPEDESDENRPPPPPPVGPGVDQGAPAELRESLAAEAFQPLELPPDKKAGAVPQPKVTPPDVAMLPPPLARRYIVVGVNGGGRRGTPAQPVAVPLWAPPPPPLAVRATTRETGIALTWTAPAIVRRPVMEHAPPPAPVPAPKQRLEASAAESPPPGDSGEHAVAGDEDDDEGATPEDAGALQDGGAPQEDAGTLQELPPVAELAVPLAAAPTQDEHASAAGAETTPSELPSGLLPSGLLPARPKIPWPAVTIGYYVYEVAPAHPAVAGVAAKPGEPPVFPRRLTQAPIKKTEYADARVQYGVERCYVVHTVETVGDLAVASDASEPACLEAADVFAPAAPTSLAAVASEGAISLIWEANNEADLRGYIVLRGRAGGAPTERLTPEPIRESAFRDASVKPGTRYVYAVIAVDTATPPNASAPSNRVEETAR